MMRQRVMLLLLIIGCLAVLPARAVERNVALLAAGCAACHGTNGHSVGETPKLAGMDQRHFIRRMEAFTRGERESTVMKHHAAGYTVEEIKLLADFFARQ